MPQPLKLLRDNACLISWIALNVCLFTVSYQKYLKPQYHHLYDMLGPGLNISRASASLINLSSALVLLPVCKTLNSILYQCLNKLSRSVFTFWLKNLKNVHITLAITIVLTSAIHTMAHFVNTANFSRNYNSRNPEINWAKYKGQSPILLVMTSSVGLTGLGMLFMLILIVLMSLKIIREHFFDLFWTTHILFLPFMCLLILHPLSGVLKEQTDFLRENLNCSDNSLKSRNSNKILLEKIDCLSSPKFIPMKCNGWLWIVTSLGVFTMDFTFRLCFRNTVLYKVSKVIDLPGDVSQITLTTRSKLVVEPGQYVLLQYPNISQLEWHPFTVTAVQRSHNQTNITFLIKRRGDWTKKVCRMVSNSGNDRISIEKSGQSRFLLDGPFSSPMENILKVRIAICIAAGIGITPFVAALNFLNKDDPAQIKPRRLHLVWVVRSKDQLTWAANLITALHHKFWHANQPDRLQIALFVTRKTIEDAPQNYSSDLLEERTYFGRPDWHELFSEWASFYNRKPASLFVCGPTSFNQEIKKISSLFNRNGCNFIYTSESFS